MSRIPSATGKPILIIDDDPSITASLTLLLKQSGYQSRSAASASEALNLIGKETFSLVLQDMNFSRMTTGAEGLQLLKEIKSRNPDLPVILITAWGSIQLAVAGIRAGASDFVTKPWTNQQLLQSVKTAMCLIDANSRQRGAAGVTREQLDEQYDFGGLIGSDPKLVKILDLVGRVSPTDASVLITGENGTGKELIAEAIHRNSPRRNRPFVKVNLGGISSTLFESEMFGHVKGAFTDAVQSRKGRFEIASGGTIFLDEIGDLDPGSQVKLLRVLQDRTYEVLGSSATRSVDVRVVSATNRNLADLVEQSLFREDLLYRLNLIAVHLPPLRERRTDISALARHFLLSIGRVYRRGNISISNVTLSWLGGLNWPGNIRQLKQVIERTVLVSGKDVLEKDDFALALEMESDDRETNSLPEAGSMTLDELERAMIVKCVEHYGGNISKVAESLGLTRAALYRRFEKYGIKTRDTGKDDGFLAGSSSSGPEPA